MRSNLGRPSNGYVKPAAWPDFIRIAVLGVREGMTQQLPRKLALRSDLLAANVIRSRQALVCESRKRDRRTGENFDFAHEGLVERLQLLSRNLGLMCSLNLWN
jgi:hypothetical protein